MLVRLLFWTFFFCNIDSASAPVFLFLGVREEKRCMMVVVVVVLLLSETINRDP